MKTKMDQGTSPNDQIRHYHTKDKHRHHLAPQRCEKEQGRLCKVDGGVGVGFDVHRAGPAYLLEQPTAERHGCFRSRYGMGNESDSVAKKEQSRSQMSVFVDDLFAVSDVLSYGCWEYGGKSYHPMTPHCLFVPSQ